MLNRLLVLAACALVMAACSSSGPQTVKRAAGHDIALYVTPALSGESNELRVVVSGADPLEVSSVALSMPDMPGMPAQRVKLSNSGNGTYLAGNLRFSMSGMWHAAVLERRQGAVAEITSFDFPVR